MHFYYDLKVNSTVNIYIFICTRVGECYHSLTAHQHQEGHTVPKQVIMIATSISSRYSLSTALCESIRYQAKSEQNVRQDLIPRERHLEAALMNPLSE